MAKFEKAKGSFSKKLKYSAPTLKLPFSWSHGIECRRATHRSRGAFAGKPLWRPELCSKGRADGAASLHAPVASDSATDRAHNICFIFWQQRSRDSRLCVWARWAGNGTLWLFLQNSPYRHHSLSPAGQSNSQPGILPRRQRNSPQSRSSVPFSAPVR